MHQHLHLTKLQWLQILKWSLYAVLFLLLLLTQGVVCARYPIFGLKINLLPGLLVCVCVREGTEKGGLFCLLAAAVLCLSGTDYGSVSVAVLTILCIFSAALCRSVLASGVWPVVVCCFGVAFLNEAVILLLRSVLNRTAISNLWLVALPACLLSTLLCPVLYFIVRAIGKIGGDNGV